MSIRRTAGQPVISSDDLQFTYKGRTFAVEISELGEFNFMTLFEQIDGKWTYPNQDPSRAVNINLDWENNAAITAAGGARMWIEKVFLPWLNGLLASLFPPTGTALTPIEQVDAMLSTTVAIVTQPDGTLKAVMR